MKIKYILLSALCSCLFTACDHSANEIYASGTFDAKQVIVSSRLNGEILELDLTEGDTVEEGQILGRIDAIPLELQKKQLLANIRSIEAKRPDMDAQLAPLAQQIKTAAKEKLRIENLFKVGAVTEKEYDDMCAQTMSLEKQYLALESSLHKSNDGITEDLISLKIQVNLMDTQIQNSSIVSPIGGEVLAQYAERGEYALPGKAIVKIANLKRVFLRAYITSAQLTGLQLGQKVGVVVDFGEEQRRSYEGTLSWISDQAEFTPKTVQTRDERSNLVYAVKVDVENDGYLKIGMYGAIKISDD